MKASGVELPEHRVDFLAGDSSRDGGHIFTSQEGQALSVDTYCCRISKSLVTLTRALRWRNVCMHRRNVATKKKAWFNKLLKRIHIFNEKIYFLKVL